MSSLMSLHIKTEYAMCFGKLHGVGNQGRLPGGGGAWLLRWALEGRTDFHRQRWAEV